MTSLSLLLRKGISKGIHSGLSSSHANQRGDSQAEQDDHMIRQVTGQRFFGWFIFKLSGYRLVLLRRRD